MPRIVYPSKDQILITTNEGITLFTDDQTIKLGYATLDAPLHFDCADGVHKLVLRIEVEKK